MVTIDPNNLQPRSPNRLHDRESFFKYVPASTARLIVQNRSLRWSSPVLFNDVFDVPRELSFGVMPTEIVQAISGKIVSLLESPPQDTSSLEPKLRFIVDTVKQGVSPEVKSELIAGIKETSERLRPSGESMESLRSMWRSWIPQFRILCLTESPAHTAMWYHYADRYKGAVLEFRCRDELDSAWLAARPVTYPSEKPEVFSAEGWASLLTMPQKLAIETLFRVATYTKSPDWSYEKEWRVATFMRPTDTGHFTDYKFNLKELSGLYLGPLMSPEDKAALRAALVPYSDVRTFEVEIGMSREFLFNEL